ncbi:MAG: hypothetical protein LJE62_08525 [Silicimonas sp.]|jgi:hypothetical protein|nr:hypothetical protein [Silicimonas sp.]
MPEFELTFPPEESEFLKSVYGKASTILEYGSGGSTLYAARETSANILSIESDRAWARSLNKVLEENAVDPARAQVQWVNIGKTRKWGYPADHTGWRRYPNYVLSPWEDGFDPDVVLIDGRFRRACLAATMMLCRRETTVLFDDYASREAYHKVEAIAKPVEIVGRLARFQVSPVSGPAPDFAAMVRWFFKPN